MYAQAAGSKREESKSIVTKNTITYVRVPVPVYPFNSNSTNIENIDMHVRTIYVYRMDVCTYNNYV